ncbi:MAG: hypothetical protein WC858_02960 [Parcubacteria group bacterium]|jgi:GNAT superfamily N-acetyltransferase
MMEKQEDNHPLGKPEVVSTPDNTNLGKLTKLAPVDLIPADLKNIPGIAGNISAFIKRFPTETSFVITDETIAENMNALLNGFTHFEDFDLEDFPELALPNGDYRRLIIYGSLRELTPDILFGVILETNPALRGKGAGVAFQEHLANLARNLGYKFLSGCQHTEDLALFFLKRGRYLMEEVKDELRTEFRIIGRQEEEADWEELFFTIKFLNPEDITRYIKPERIDTSVEDKIEFKKKYYA